MEKENTPKNILIVDDNKAVTLILVTWLDHKDGMYDVDIANDGQEALDLCMRNDYDLVITDFHMPHMSGIEVAESLLLKKPNTKLILMTGSALAEARAAAEHLPFRAILSKPFVTSEFQQLVQEVLDASNALHEIQLV